MSFSAHYPIDVEKLILYVAYLSNAGYAPGTVKTYLAGIGHLYKILGYADPTNQFLLRKVVEGMIRTDKRQDVRAPITYTLLERLVKALPFVCFSVFEAQMFKAAYLITYFAMLRVSEVVSDGPSSSTARALQISDIAFTPGYSDMYVTIRYSKTDQTGISTTLQIQSLSDGEMCPIQGIQVYLQVRPHVQGPTNVFCHFNGKPLTKYQFGAILKKSLEFAGVKGGVYRSHSLRIGACSTAIKNGLGESAVKTIGMWKSNAYLSYIR
jgi:hypothetical protein